MKRPILLPPPGLPPTLDAPRGETPEAYRARKSTRAQRIVRRIPGPIGRELARFFDALEILPTIVFVTAGLTLWLYDYYASIQFFNRVWAPMLKLSPKALEPLSYFYWYGCTFVMLMLIPQLVVRISTRALRSDAIPTLGWRLGDWRFGLPCVGMFYGVMLVILCVAVGTSDFQARYPLFADADRSLQMFAAYEGAYALYFVAWEYFFRGFMTFSLEKTLGIWTIFVQMLPFVVMHFGKPDLEAMSSVFAGIALGYLAYRTRSFWYGVVIHGATAVTLDVLVVLVKHHHPHQ